MSAVALSPQHDGRASCRLWTGERIARLGFLLGLGWDANRIAEDPTIASTPNNVHRQAQRFGLAFRASPFNLPESCGAVLDRAASKRSLAREALIRRLLLEIAADSSLLDNVLDDEFSHENPAPLRVASGWTAVL